MKVINQATVFHTGPLRNVTHFKTAGTRTLLKCKEPKTSAENIAIHFDSVSESRFHGLLALITPPITHLSEAISRALAEALVTVIVAAGDAEEEAAALPSWRHSHPLMRRRRHSFSTIEISIKMPPRHQCVCVCGGGGGFLEKKQRGHNENVLEIAASSPS